MFLRSMAYMLTMVGVLITVTIVGNIILAVLGVKMNGASMAVLLLTSAIFGFAGSLISLFLSKTIVKKSMGVEVITNPSSQAEKWLVNTVAGLAAKKGVKMPEVGIYQANEMNAFATGWNRNDALVAVSTGLLDKMEQDEIEAVLGHELSHVANGDMVTQTLLQGVVNTFVYFISFVLSSIIANALANRDSENSSSSGLGSTIVYHAVASLLQVVFGILGTMVVMWFSRWREYHADRGSAQVLGKDAMINALEALKRQVVEEKPENVKALCIAGAPSFAELFMTHPPLEKRIAALKAL